MQYSEYEKLINETVLDTDSVKDVFASDKQYDYFCSCYTALEQDYNLLNNTISTLKNDMLTYPTDFDPNYINKKSDAIALRLKHDFVDNVCAKVYIYKANHD